MRGIWVSTEKSHQCLYQSRLIGNTRPHASFGLKRCVPLNTAIGVTLATASQYTCKLGFGTSLLRLDYLHVEPEVIHLHELLATGRLETLLDLGLARSCLEVTQIRMNLYEIDFDERSSYDD